MCTALQPVVALALIDSRWQSGRECKLEAELSTSCGRAERARGKLATDRQVWGLTRTSDDHNMVVARPVTCISSDGSGGYRISARKDSGL